MTAPTKQRPWTYAAAVVGWVGGVHRTVVLGWDAAEPPVFALCVTDPRTGLPLEWWLDRAEAAKGVDGVVGDWMWQCTRNGVPHVAVRPLTGSTTVLMPEEALGRFLVVVEWFAPHGGLSFADEVAALLGGAS